MIDHTSFAVKNYEESIKFYDETLKLLGYERLINIDIPSVKVAGYGKAPKPSFWISSAGYNEEEEIGKAKGFHVGFTASGAQEVDAWYKKCLELGGLDNGAPGIRPHYHSGYYGAFIIDPSGWRIEACFHEYNVN